MATMPRRDFLKTAAATAAALAFAPRRLFNPFAGSGSEAIGAMQAGWDEIVSVDMSDEYAAIARARFEYWHRIERTKTYLFDMF